MRVTQNGTNWRNHVRGGISAWCPRRDSRTRPVTGYPVRLISPDLKQIGGGRRPLAQRMRLILALHSPILPPQSWSFVPRELYTFMDIPMIGQIISHYRILERLGGGGMGLVYKAQDLKLDRPVALKFLPHDLTRDPEAKKRFVYEAKAASALQHNNVCTVHDIDESPDGQMFMVMDFYEGETLKKKIERGPMKIDEAVAIAAQVLEGLAKAHEHGIVHRDIKPANIMVTTEGVAKIVDFGLAKLSGRTLLTRTGSTLGTIAYMSPEQALGNSVDLRTDIWSLGVVLYEMVCGQRPFASDVEEALIYAIRNDEPKPLRHLRPDAPQALEDICAKSMAKRPESRYGSAAAMLRDLREYPASARPARKVFTNLRTMLLRFKEPRVAIPAIFVLCAVATSTMLFFHHQEKVRWARDELLPQARMLKSIDEDIYANVEAYRLAEMAEEYIPGDPALAELFSKLAVPLTVRTDPPGARVFLKDYGSPDSAWRYVGMSPIEQLRVPIWFVELKMEKEGYEPVHMATLTGSYRRSGWVPDTIQRRLDAEGVLPSDMVRIPGVGSHEGVGPVGDFYFDRTEVTNKRFRDFVNGGGYQNRKYWRQPFVKDGKQTSWETAMKGFVDQTGRPGPSTWQAGAFPEGQEYYPVSGISWYEAAAFAEYAGKVLPSVYHWDIARGANTRLLRSTVFSEIVLASSSNLAGQGPVAVGSSPGITSYGLYDMAGNVREWCWNESQKGRIVRGGAWNDVPYMFDYWSQASPFDRSPKNGFRCALYVAPEKIPGSVFQQVQAKELRDFYRDKPVSDATFKVYRDQFSYDKTPLDARLEWRKESSPEWIQEKVSFNAAYENERVTAYLFLPRNPSPPYQTVVYFPGGVLAAMMRSSEDIEHYRDFDTNVRFLLQSGRAVLFPIYKGTFERGSDHLLSIHLGDTTHEFSVYFAKVVKDFKRSVDYLETRTDIDRSHLAYFGFCWGGWCGAIIPAVEDRLKASVLEIAGFRDTSRPEVNELNYVTRVKLPTLLLSGRYDAMFPLESSARPMFALLGTPKQDKKHLVYETDHFIPHNELIKETLAWLDKYLGPTY
jgi:eukaryotic-like serine/threonine-protein kinase